MFCAVLIFGDVLRVCMDVEALCSSQSYLFFVCVWHVKPLWYLFEFDEALNKGYAQHLANAGYV